MTTTPALPDPGRASDLAPRASSDTAGRPLLRVAVPNKGSLSQAASDVLHEAGYKQRHDGKQLTLVDVANGVEFFYLRPRDIAVYVGEGTLDLGITGRDLLLDSGAKAEEAMQLGFGRSTFRFAARPGVLASGADLAGKRIATSYAGVVGRYLEERGIEATVIRLDGAVETSVQLGVADVIADVVETGSTLRQAGLEIAGEVVLESEAVLISRVGRDAPGLEVFLRRLQGVLVARSYVMMDYDIPTAQVERAVALTPGIESPTVSPLHREGWVAVRSMVPRDRAQRIMDELFDIGARGILTTDIHACRL
jgi:ATP phosphoribosyltransferase